MQAELETLETAPVEGAASARASRLDPVTVKAVAGCLAVGVAAALALAVNHLPDKQKIVTHSSVYAWVLWAIVGAAVVALATLSLGAAWRGRVGHLAPAAVVATLGLAVWELLTAKLALLPLPYFPGPEMVLTSLTGDTKLLGVSALHSGLLLATGYLLGTIVGLTTGVAMGWSRGVFYWAMPVLRLIGPMPATAWIPIALVLLPTTFWAAVFLIGLAVWFPVTINTMSGVANVRQSFLDVARTLGAKPSYLVFRVALPAALPHIFSGLFMGLGNSFLTLIVAEMLGVKAGLGWYINWATGWAEFSKVYAALVVMAIFFSSVMTLQFRLRDRVLAWQQGVIKW